MRHAIHAAEDAAEIAVNTLSLFRGETGLTVFGAEDEVAVEREVCGWHGRMVLAHLPVRNFSFRLSGGSARSSLHHRLISGGPAGPGANCLRADGHPVLVLQEVGGTEFFVTGDHRTAATLPGWAPRLFPPPAWRTLAGMAGAGALAAGLRTVQPVMAVSSNSIIMMLFPSA